MTPQAAQPRLARALERVVIRACTLLLLIATACTEAGEPVSLTGDGRVRLALQPHFVSFGATSNAVVSRIRIVARDKATNQEIGRTVEDVNPNATEWQLSVEVKLPGAGTTNVELTIELVDAQSGNETVEWSGTTTVAVSPGQTQSPAALALFRGPLANVGVTAIRIAGAVGPLVEGTTMQLSASAEGATGTPQIFWSALDPGIATVNAAGLVQGVLPGRARIVAFAGPRADTVSITVLQRQASVQVTPDAATVTMGATASYTARVLDPRGAAVTGAAVTWSIADPGIAENLGNGQFRARAAGATTVTAASQAQPTLRASARLVVEQRAGTIEVAPFERRLTAIGARQQYTAIVRDASGNIMAGARLTWSSSVPAVATIDANGLATTTGEGTTTIRVSTPVNPAAPSGEAISAEATLTVSQSIALVDVQPANDTLFSIGETVQLRARALDGGAVELRDRTFSWTSSNSAVASVDANGRVTANAVGAVTITAETGGVSGSATILVVQSAVRVFVSPQFVTATALNERIQFSARAQDRNNFPVAGGGTPRWTSTNPLVATISETGLATTRGFGTTTIIAEIAGVRGEAHVTVRASVNTVTVTPADVTLMNPGERVQLTAVVTNPLGQIIAGAPITWTTYDASVATVSPTGLVTAVFAGTTPIVATSGDAIGMSIVTVGSRAPVATITLTPNRATLGVGRTLALVATARDVANNIIPAPGFTWTSSDPSKVTVSTSGLINAIAAGTATITVSAGGRSASALITVYAPVATAISKVSGDAQTGSVSTQLGSPLVVQVIDQTSNPMAGHTVSWVVTSGGGSVSAGTTTTDADGFAQVRWTMGPTTTAQRLEARSAGLTGSPILFSATAVPANVATITVTPATKTLTAGDTATLTATARDPGGVVQPGVVFAWSSSDTTIAVVDASGRVKARRAGTATISATANGKTGSATVTVNPGPATFLTGYSGNGQAAVVSSALRDPLVVQVLDAGGNPIGGVTVTWVVTGGGGTRTPATSVTGADGLASTSWTMGPTPGTNTLEARVTGLLGSPIVFTATASAPAGVRKTWVGGAASAPNNWTIPENWSPVGVPSDRDTVFIPASAANQPALNGDVRIVSLIVEAGASLNNSGYIIEVLRHADISGSVTNLGYLIMTGAGVTVRGTISNLDVQGTVTAVGPVNITQDLVVQGNLTLNSQTVTVTGDFTAGVGTVTMSNVADVLNVRGNITFYAGDHTGKLTGGTIQAGGDFTLGCYNNTTEFNPTGTKLLMNGSAPQRLALNCSESAGNRLFELTVAAGANVSTSDNPLFISSKLIVNGTFTINSGAVVDVAGPAGSVMVSSGGVLNNNGTLKANLPVSGPVTGNAPVQR